MSYGGCLPWGGTLGDGYALTPGRLSTVALDPRDANSNPIDSRLFLNAHTLKTDTPEPAHEFERAAALILGCTDQQ